MKHSIKNFLVVVVLFICNVFIINAQETKTKDSIDINIKPYGSFRGHFAAFNNELEFQENASRIGFEFGIRKNNLEFFAGLELGISLFKGNSQFNPDGNTSGGFLVLENSQATQVFNSRLGYLGIDFNEWGRLSFGKQWSVYYDITSFTDRFNVFGGQGSATYNAGTDGGSTGTGRADQSIIYRNEIGIFEFGLQLQTKNTTNNSFFDGYGISTRIRLMEQLKIGAAFYRSILNDVLIDNESFLGLGADPTYFTAGADYNGDKLEVSAVFSMQSDGDLVQTVVERPDNTLDPASVIFDAIGFEIRAKYTYKKFSFIGGYNSYTPEADDLNTVDGLVRFDEDFKTSNIILGLEYKPTKRAYFYAEGRLTNGKDVFGLPVTDVLTLGLRIELDKTFSNKIGI